MYFNAIDNASVMMELVPLMMQQSNMPYRKPSSTTATEYFSHIIASNFLFNIFQANLNLAHKEGRSDLLTTICLTDRRNQLA